MMDNLRQRAWKAGGGSYEAHRRYDSAAELVSDKFEAIRREVPNAVEPTDVELENLRNRYIESEALTKRTDTLLRQENGELDGEIFRFILLVIYRVVVFVAACTIIYRLALQ